MENDKFIFTCTDGTEVELLVASHAMMHGIDARVEREFTEAGRQVNPPQYIAVLPGGTEEPHDHDETSIQDKDTPEEQREQWQEYLDTQQEIEDEASDRRGLFIFREGMVTNEETAQNGDWIARYEKWCDPVPVDPDERFMVYVQAELLKTPADQMEAVNQIMALMTDGVPEEVVGSLQQMFRDSLEQDPALDALQSDLGQVAGGVVDKPPAGDGEPVRGRERGADVGLPVAYLEGPRVSDERG